MSEIQFTTDYQAQVLKNKKLFSVLESVRFGRLSPEEAKKQFEVYAEYLARVPMVPCRKQAEVDLLWLIWNVCEGHCAYCNVEMNPFDRYAPNGFQVDHITPKCRGGRDELENYVGACRSCNNSKGGKSLSEWRGSDD